MSDESSLNQLQTVSLALRGLAGGVFLVFLSTINFHIYGLSLGLTFIPIFTLMYWPMQASKSWSMFFIFLLGLLQSTISFSPLGLWSLSYLALFTVLGREVKFSDRLFSTWASFFGCVLFVCVILYFVGRLQLGQWPLLSSLATDAIASILVFPLLFWGRNMALTFGREPERREIN